MNTSPLQSGSLKLASVMGIPIRVHFSWLIIFGLITWSLSAFYFPKVAPELPGLSYWLSGAMAALLLFISVVLHELSHSYIALRYGLKITSITLFIFGGVAQMKSEPQHPKVEFKMAIAGPLSSILLSLIFFMAYTLVENQIGRALFQYMAHLNLGIGLFNLIPGFPMDGGRVVRAYIWNKSGDFNYATRMASVFGRMIATSFIIFGFISIFTGFPGGLWLMLIGWFLHSAAQTSYIQAGLREALTMIKVKDIMVKDIVTVASDITVSTAAHEYFLKYGFGGFPVVDNGRFLGILTLKEIMNIPKEKWKDVAVSKIYMPRNTKWEVSENDNAWKALELMINEDKGRLAVVDRGNLIGLITRNGIAKHLQIMSELKK